MESTNASFLRISFLVNVYCKFFNLMTVMYLNSTKYLTNLKYILFINLIHFYHKLLNYVIIINVFKTHVISVMK